MVGFVDKQGRGQTLTVLPLTINNLINAYDAESGTIAMRLTLPDLQDPTQATCQFLDLGALLPGNPAADQFSDTLKPFINQCKTIGKQITNNVLTPILPVLPFGIMSNNKLQRAPVPGTVPGNPDPEIGNPPSERAPASSSTTPRPRGGN